jgi:hypothetical protein
LQNELIEPCFCRIYSLSLSLNPVFDDMGNCSLLIEKIISSENATIQRLNG